MKAKGGFFIEAVAAAHRAVLGRRRCAAPTNPRFFALYFSLLAAFCLTAEARGGVLVFQKQGSAESRYVTVIGEVNQPTRIRSDQRIKLTQVLAFCGGLTSEADERRIIIFGPRGIEVFDLRRVRNSSREPFVYPGDTVRVRDL